jgi:hypothetical protein
MTAIWSTGVCMRFAASRKPLRARVERPLNVVNGMRLESDVEDFSDC